jgi:hypothetical protein
MMSLPKRHASDEGTSSVVVVVEVLYNLYSFAASCVQAARREENKTASQK